MVTGEFNTLLVASITLTNIIATHEINHGSVHSFQTTISLSVARIHSDEEVKERGLSK